MSNNHLSNVSAPSGINIFNRGIARRLHKKLSGYIRCKGIKTQHWVPVHEEPALVTVSYAGDVEWVKDLLLTRDQCGITLNHYIIVDPWEIKLFSDQLSAFKFEILNTQDVVPSGFWSWWKANRAKPRAGYWKQQVVKICAAAYIGHNHTLIVDSDFMFVRPIDSRNSFSNISTLKGDFFVGKQVRWLTTAERIANAHRYFGLKLSRYDTIDATAPLQLMIRPVTLMLIEAMVKNEGARWWKPIVMYPFFTEYALYQAFGRTCIDPVLRPDIGAISINRSPWDKLTLKELVSGVTSNKSIIGIVLQSTLENNEKHNKMRAQVRKLSNTIM